MVIHVYTDGACKGNPGKGGWGVYWSDNGVDHEMCGGDADTTNNRMELTAVIKALEMVQGPKKVWTDSQYVYKGITEWMSEWKKKDWKNSHKRPVLNQDLWKRVDELLLQSTTPTEFAWVKAHNGEKGNEKADALANQGLPTQRHIGIHGTGARFREG